MKPALVVWDGKSNPEPPPVRLALVHDGSGITLCSVDDRGHVINCGEIASISIDDQYRIMIQGSCGMDIPGISDDRPVLTYLT